MKVCIICSVLILLSADMQGRIIGLSIGTALVWSVEWHNCHDYFNDYNITIITVTTVSSKLGPIVLTAAAERRLGGKGRPARGTAPSTSPRQSSLCQWWFHPGWRRSRRQPLSAENKILGSGHWEMWGQMSKKPRLPANLPGSHKWPLLFGHPTGPHSRRHLTR